ncbi:MAG: M23 family metallopeptidase, partial [Chloroflexota bacterium]
EQDEKKTLQLQRQNQHQLLARARVEAQDASTRINGHEAQVQALIDQKQGQLSANEKLLQQLKDAQDQISSAINNQADTLAQATRQRQVAQSELDRLGKQAEGIAAVIARAEAGRPVKTYASGGLIWPLHGVIEQGFGPTPYWFEPPMTYNGVRYAHFHTGLDIAAPYGTPIHAAADGRVISTVYSNWGYGIHVIIAHSPTLATLYAHMSRMAVTQGEEVKQGQVIGYEGSTGNSTGPHVHFEVRVNGQFVNPLSYL